MPAMDFPNTPAIGDTFGSSGTVWRWDGARWVSTSGPSGASGVVAYAQRTTNQTTITTVVDLTSLSVTWTAVPGRIYRTSFICSVFSSVANDGPTIQVTDSAGTTTFARGTAIPSISNAGITCVGSVIESGLSGSITRKLRASRAFGTGVITVEGSPAFPAYIMVEDVTYEAGSSGNNSPAAIGGVWTLSTSSSVLNATVTTIPFNTERWRNGVTISSGVVSVQTAGLYQINYNASWTTATTGYRNCWISINDNPAMRLAAEATDAVVGVSILAGGTLWYLNVGDTVRVQSYQTSGAALNLSGDNVLTAITAFSLTRIGA